MKRQAAASDSDSESSDDDFGPAMPRGLNQTDENGENNEKEQVTAVKVPKKKKKKTKFEQVSYDEVQGKNCIFTYLYISF